MVVTRIVKISTVKIDGNGDDPFCYRGYEMSRWLVEQGLIEYIDFDWLPTRSARDDEAGGMIFKFFDCDKIVPLFVLKWIKLPEATWLQETKNFCARFFGDLLTIPYAIDIASAAAVPSSNSEALATGMAVRSATIV